MRPLKIGLAIILLEGVSAGLPIAWSEVRRRALWAEEVGFDTIWIPDELLWEADSWPGPRGWGGSALPSPRRLPRPLLTSRSARGCSPPSTAIRHSPPRWYLPSTRSAADVSSSDSAPASKVMVEGAGPKPHHPHDGHETAVYSDNARLRTLIGGWRLDSGTAPTPRHPYNSGGIGWLCRVPGRWSG